LGLGIEDGEGVKRKRCEMDVQIELVRILSILPCMERRSFAFYFWIEVVLNVDTNMVFALHCNHRN